MRVQRVRFVVLSFVASLCAVILAPNIRAQNPPAQPPVPPAPKIQAPAAQVHGAVRITLDEAIQLALEHNHNLKAAETTIQQDQALGNHREPPAKPNADGGRAIPADLSAGQPYRRLRRQRHAV